MKTSRWLSEITKAGNQNACDTVVQAKTKGAVLETVNMWSYVNTLHAEAQPAGRPFCPCATAANACEKHLRSDIPDNSPNHQKTVFGNRMADSCFQSRKNVPLWFDTARGASLLA